MNSVTLPIDAADSLRMDPKEARALGSLLAKDYAKADPFPHIVMDGILPEPLIRKLYGHFPKEELSDDIVFDIGYGGHHKRQVMPEQCDDFVRHFFHFMNSQPVLQFLEGLTGIEALLPDPYFEGGGFHETSRGGKLGVHADFRIHGQLHVQRRINLLIYLNETWQDEWKGQLELWNRSMTECRARVSPIWNRCVVLTGWTLATSLARATDAHVVTEPRKRSAFVRASRRDCVDGDTPKSAAKAGGSRN